MDKDDRTYMFEKEGEGKEEANIILLEKCVSDKFKKRLT